MRKQILVLTFFAFLFLGCAPQRDYSYGGGSRTISSPALVMHNITNQLRQANYNVSSFITNDVFTAIFSKRSIHGKVFIDWKTFKPVLDGDLVDKGVNYTIEIRATWFAPNDATETVCEVIHTAFDLSKGDLWKNGETTIPLNNGR